MRPISAEEEAKPYRLRIPNSSPREKYKAASGRRFEKRDRWYPITEEEKQRYSKVLLFDTNAASPPLFQIVSKAEASRIDIEENVAGANQEAAAAAREAKLQQQLEETQKELEHAKKGVLAAHQRMDSLQRDYSIMGDRFARLMDMVETGKLVPAGQRDAEAKVEQNSEAKVEAKADDTKVEQKPEAKVEPKPARPGEKRDGKKASKPETKADEDAKIESKTVAETSPTEAYDESLKAEGFTPNR